MRLLETLFFVIVVVPVTVAYVSLAIFVAAFKLAVEMLITFVAVVVALGALALDYVERKLTK